jgi:hypothetical protein
MSDSFGAGLSDYIDQFELPTEERKAPTWPVFLGLVLLLTSLALAIPGFSMDGAWLLIVGALGYILTPLGTAFVLIMAMRAHRQMSAIDGYKADSGTRVIRLCAYIAVAGFVLAVPHIWQIADYFALLFAPGA